MNLQPQMTMTNETKDSAKAQEAADKLAALHDEWSLKLTTAQKELRSFDANGGDLALDAIMEGNDSSGDAANRLVHAQASYEVATKMLAAIERRQVVAEAELKEAQARELRLQAGEKRTERDTHASKVNALLGKLKELDAVEYVASNPPKRRAVTMDRTISNLLDRARQLESQAENLRARGGVHNIEEGQR